MVVHREKIRWLFWLRRKMFLRGLRRNGKTNIVGMIIFSLFLLVGGGFLAFFTSWAYRNAPAPINSEVLFLVLTGLFVLWIILPLLQYTTNEGLDLSKLMLFPLTRWELMISLLISTVFDMITIGLLLLLGAVVVGWATSVPLALFALLTMLVFYVQLVAVSQLVLALLQPVMQSRRLRDLSILLSVFFVAAIYLWQYASRFLANLGFVEGLQHAAYSPYLQWLPGGMAARAIQQASIGNWGPGVIWLLALIVVSGIMLYLWSVLLERSLVTIASSEGSSSSVRRKKRGPASEALSTSHTETEARRAGWLPVQVRAVMLKEVRYWWRDPLIKAMLLQSLIVLAALVAAYVFPQLQNGKGNAGTFRSSADFLEFYVPIIALLSLFSLSYNTLGFERQSLTTLLLFPIKARQVLLGKNLPVIVLGIIEVVGLSIAITSVTQLWNLLAPAITVGLTGICILLSIGNITSVLFPQKARMRGMRNMSSNVSAEAGCLRSLTSLGALFVTAVLLVPVFLGILIPLNNQMAWLWSITLPASLLYGIIIYVAILNVMAQRFINRIPEILEVVTRE